MQTEWLARDSSSSIAVYMVWLPELGAEERHVPDASRLLPDPRARHYWDPGRRTGEAYQDDLGLARPAWDVWLLFEPDAVWRDEPPPPTWWEHQLYGLPAERHLDAARFARKAGELLH